MANLTWDTSIGREKEERMRRVLKLVAVSTVGVAMLAAPAPAFAGSRDVVKTGTCSDGSTWKLKLSRDNGAIEVEFEVDQNVVGDTWRVVIRQNGDVLKRGRRTTQAPSGSFEFRALGDNTAGTDRFKARAVNLETSETCVARASL
jgi:hypothetical protein